MKGILEFELPEDEELFELSKKGPRTYWNIQEFDNWLRNLIKHHEPETWPNLEQVREKLWECLNDE